MSWIATDRFGARTAPGGLALVQEMVNTHATERGGVDLLADAGSAGRWMRAAAEEWARSHGLEAPVLSLSPAGLEALRELRETLNTMLAVPPGERLAGERAAGPFRAGGLTAHGPVQLASDPQGRATLIPLGTDADWIVSAVWSEILLAQRGDEWSRIKLCRESGCRSAFYDGSRNGSATWHNVRTCGNMANLRASRARRRGPQES
jgi:predicted RNA-binding Zn ribbon-like protein